jgi:RNA polymerase sigma factor (sigma-70 family)
LRDREAWEELYAAYAPRLRSFGYRLAGNAHDADDLVQETFVRAVPRLDRLDPETADVGAYLFTTLRNLFLKQVERTNRQQPVAEVPEPVLPTPIEDDPERGTLLRSQQADVRLANARLQPRQRLVLALRELEDRSYAEIGELVGMKENAVAQLIFRARESLRTELRLAEVDPERLPEACRRYLPLLAAHLDGQLKPPRLEETLVHLEGCDRCQAALESMREASRRYRALVLPALLETDEARAAVERRLDELAYWEAPGARSLRSPKRLAAVGAAVIALGGGGAALGVGLSRDGGAARHSDPAAEAARAPATVATTEAGSTAEPTSTPVPTATTATDPAASIPAPAPKKRSTASTTTTHAAEAAPSTTVPPLAPSPAPSKPKPKPTAKVPAALPDTKAPAVTITLRPATTVATDAVRIAFRANEAATFTCRVDAGSFAPCTSPVDLSGLAEGPHTFAVRAQDAAGNVGGAVKVGWTFIRPDTTPPTVTITSAPAASTADANASFSFSATEDGVTFECSLDGAAFASCTSPIAYAALAAGPHAFAVRGRDAAGNTSAASTASWSIVTPLPDLVVGSFSKYSITVVNRGTAAAAPSVLTITLVGTFTVPALAPGAVATFSWSICRVGTYSAIVDRTAAVAESDESNNTAARRNTCP